MKIICPNCRSEYKPLQIGVNLVTTAHGGQPQEIYSADVKVCRCDNHIIIPADSPANRDNDDMFDISLDFMKRGKKPLFFLNEFDANGEIVGEYQQSIDPRPRGELRSDLQKFWDRLDNYDWYSDFSDDSNVWRRAKVDMAEIRTWADEGGQEYIDLMNEFSIHKFTGPAWNNEQKPKPDYPKK